MLEERSRVAGRLVAVPLWSAIAAGWVLLSLLSGLVWVLLRRARRERDELLAECYDHLYGQLRRRQREEAEARADPEHPDYERYQLE
jgi:hypothetical protein